MATSYVMCLIVALVFIAIGLLVAVFHKWLKEKFDLYLWEGVKEEME